MAPDPAVDRFSFRDDASVQDVSGLLPKNGGVINILDCGCGDCRLARALMLGQVPTSRINYYGFDSDGTSVRSSRAALNRGEFNAFKSFEVSLREVTNLAGYKPGSFHLVNLTNLLHEVCPELLPELFKNVNKLLIQPSGKACIVDMEQLPTEVNEPWAVPWAGDEMEGLLTSGGFTVSACKHPKRVPVFRIVVNARRDVNVVAMNQMLRDLLTIKRAEIINQLSHYRDTGDCSGDSVRAACRLAALEVSLRRIESGGFR